MIETMIDIETLSTEPNACILTIGAIKFNRNDNIIEIDKMEKFYKKIDIESCKKLKLHIDKKTIKWWEQQSESAKKEAFEGDDRESLDKVLDELSIFVKDSKYIWANSINFDTVILENAYKKSKKEIPWKFYNLRCCRTVYDLGNVSLKNISKTTEHHALLDCYNQITALKKSVQNINK